MLPSFPHFSCTTVNGAGHTQALFSGRIPAKQPSNNCVIRMKSTGTSHIMQGEDLGVSMPYSIQITRNLDGQLNFG